MNTVKIKIIIGSTRPGRFSEKPAYFIADELKKRTDVLVELLDLRDYPMAFFNETTSPARLNEQYSDEMVKKWSGQIKDADGFIIVTPEYNHSFPAVLKNALDVIEPEWNKKPVGFISYGGVGGARSIEQLRLIAIELQMIPIKNSLNIPSDIYRTIMNEQTPVPTELFKGLREPIDRIGPFLDELIQFATILKPMR